MSLDCALVIPCRDEAPALPDLFALIPVGFEVIVVDNGSRDGTARVARELGATVVEEDSPGYGAAVHAGVLAARSTYVAVIDGDGSLDPSAVVPLLGDVRRGVADMAVGRRRPVGRGSWPWHARVGNAVVLAWLRRHSGIMLRDIAPIRVCRRLDLIDLDVQDRRFGYPVELLVKAHAAGWTVSEHDVDYRPRAAGTTSKVSGSVTGTMRTIKDFAKVLAS